MTIFSVKDLFKIPIQIRCVSPQICSISSVLNFKVKHPQEFFGKITVISVSYLSNCMGEILSCFGA